MTSSYLEPVAESTTSAPAGCGAGPDQASAGCVAPAGDEGQAAAPPAAAGESAGCAAPAPVDASDQKATPPQTLREFERALRGLGFTRLQAQHIAQRGFAGVTANTEAAPEPERQSDDMQALVAALQRRARAFER